MPIQEGLFWAQDGERLFYRFQAGLQGKKLILLIHGHGEHSGRYIKFFSQLEALENPIVAFDLRGCGRSSGERVHVRRFEDYLSDISSLLHFLSERFQIESPILLFGHSLGGLIATAWAHQNSSKVSKLILSSPLFGIPRAAIFQVLVRALDRFAPRFIIRNPVKPVFLTHDAEEVERYKKDPLIQRRISVRLTHEMLRYTTFFREGNFEFPFPVYILMAQQDYIVDPHAARQFFLRLHAPEKELESFSGFFHEIFNEKEQEKAFDRLKYYLGR